LIISLSLLLLSLQSSGVVIASESDQSSGNDESVAGLASTALECLSVGTAQPGEVSSVVRLTWQGRVERARLVLSVSGAEAAHTIKVNGRAVALAPIQPGGQPCSAEEYFYLDIAPDALKQGDNVVEITDAALSGDQWTAAQVRLEVFGDLVIVPRDLPGPLGVTSVASVTAIITFVNAYDGSSQNAMIQLPDGYTGIMTTPLLIAVHGRSGIMENGVDWYKIAANNKGWLLASPQLHGSWDPDPSCYSSSVTCDFDDEVITQNGKPGAYAYAALESQYDVIGTVKYMVQNHNVDPSRIYLTGDSMGGQISVITAAKFPHLFAAIFDNKGPMDMAEWYGEQVAYYGTANDSAVRAMRKECHIAGAPKTPAENPFCYQRRSGLNFASNYLHVPISMTHSISDTLVPVHHSRDLRTAINSYSPDRLAAVAENSAGECPPPGPQSYHCYEPNRMTVLNFLEQFTLNNNPHRISVTADESKSYYWLNIAQTGGPHWTHVDVVYYPLTLTVVATVSDTLPLTLGFNLGTTPLSDVTGISQPGMGLPATAYTVKGGGNDYVYPYTSGYLTVTLASPGLQTVTISTANRVYVPLVRKNP